MAAFTYDAINAQGLQLKGEIHAADVVSAQEQLRSRGLLAQNLVERRAKGETGARTAFKKVKAKSLQVFFRQLATMIEAGVSVVAALVTLEEQTDDKYLREVIAEIRSDVEAGMVLSTGVRAAPEGVQPPVRLADRGGRVVGHARRGARPGGDADREGDAAQAPRPGRDDLSRQW